MCFGWWNQETKLLLLVFPSIGINQSLKYSSSFFRNKSILIFANDNTLDGDLLITEKQRNPVSRNWRTGHEFNAEKPERMFMYDEENVEEFHNKSLSNNFCMGQV